MAEPLRLLAILAHPDDESMAVGNTLAKYAAEGIETYLIVATGGERGWQGDPAANPGLEKVKAIRRAELLAATKILGIKEVVFLDYLDGELDQVEPLEAIAKIAAHIRRIRPDVVLTFAADGYYGHPDHIAISQLTSGAIVAAAYPNNAASESPYQVAKLYHIVMVQERLDLLRQMFGSSSTDVDDDARSFVVWPNWAVTTWIDGDPYSQTASEAVRCHRSQISAPDGDPGPVPDVIRRASAIQTFYRVFSLVNGGPNIEHDLFAGLR
jgi:LmbE family N-acetylglucosaminyl deacetylase